MRALSWCVLLSVLAAPAAQAAEDVWRGLGWDMPIDVASQTLTRQGLQVRERGPRKSPESYLSTDVDGLHATIYFDGDGRMNQITVIAESTTNDAVAAAKERLTKRFGTVKEIASRAERAWGSSAKLLVVDTGTREEYSCDDAGAPLGAFDLTCGQSASDVEQRLRAAGFTARTTPMLIDPCEMQNAPFGCEPDASVNVVFSKGDDEGVADVHKKRGLLSITFESHIASYADGLAREKAIEASCSCGVRRRQSPLSESGNWRCRTPHATRGPATRIEDATITSWSDATANVSLDVREEKPSGALSAIETYSPPQPRPN